MDQQSELYFSYKKDWRNWLEKHHGQKEPIWLVYYKKECEKESISYDDSVEQALCFGWIDGIIKSIDNEKYKRKFMPRTNFFNWSPTNRLRVEKLLKSGEMTEIGLNAIGNYAKTKQLVWPVIEEHEFTGFSENLMEMLQANDEALQFYNSLSKSHQRHYVMWVMTAKREETRIKRMEEALILLKNKTKNLLK